MAQTEENMKNGVNATEKWPLQKFERNSWPLLYWKLHPLAVVCVKEAFIGLPRDLRNIFKGNMYGKMHSEFLTIDL